MHKYRVDVRVQLNGADRSEAECVVSREPVWTYLIYIAAEWCCVLTRHRLVCNRVLRHPMALSDRHTEEFKFAMSADDAAEFRRWRGWEDDED